MDALSLQSNDTRSIPFSLLVARQRLVHQPRPCRLTPDAQAPRLRLAVEEIEQFNQDFSPRCAGEAAATLLGGEIDSPWRGGSRARSASSCHAFEVSGCGFMPHI